MKPKETTALDVKANDPIELFLVALLALLEATCWLINELAGFHEPTRIVKPVVQPLFADLQALTVKQLKQLTGLNSSKLRKHELIQIYCAY